MWDISAIKNCAPKKVGQNSPKLLKACYPLKPPIIPNFIEISENHLGEKHYKNLFTPFNILAPQGDPLGQRSPAPHYMQ